MRVLLAGGSGVPGGPTTEALKAEGHEVARLNGQQGILFTASGHPAGAMTFDLAEDGRTATDYMFPGL